MRKATHDIVTDPSTSTWLRQAVIAFEARDPLDALQDAERLVELASARWWDLVKAKGAA